MCSVCAAFEERRIAAGILKPPYGAVAQLVERFHGMEEAARSIRVSSTDPLASFHRFWRCIGFTLGGFVAGEGWFATKTSSIPFKRDGSPRLRFVFGVTVATRDRPLLEALACFLGHGVIRDTPSVHAGRQPLSQFAISSSAMHRAATIPFAEQYLLPCLKRRQFEVWRDALADYEDRRPSQYGRGPSPCSIAGCGKPVRGRGLCRSHYYRATGH